MMWILKQQQLTTTTMTTTMMMMKMMMMMMKMMPGSSFVSSTEKNGEMCVAYESSYHIEKGCECLVFESFGGSQGSFTSPNFPSPYPPKTPCILYTFIGDANETVQISFEYFNLPFPASVYGSCTDFVRLYLDLERPEMSSDKMANFEICGNLSSVDSSYFSLNRSLILEFHSESQSTSMLSGFKASYQFLLKSRFQMKGVTRRWDAECIHNFHSIDFPGKSGNFFSPGFPYPANISCKYYFYGNQYESIFLNFTSVQLDSSPLRCRSDFKTNHYNAGGTVIIRDGFDELSNVLETLCGSMKASERLIIVSNKENVFVEFTKKESSRFQGFAANFRFEFQEHKKFDENMPHSPNLLWTSKTSKTQSTDAKHEPDDSNGLGLFAQDQFSHSSPDSANSENTFIKRLQSTESYSNCNYSINSGVSEQGIISAPGYPRSYPENQTCKYILRGRTDQQIQLVFLDFDLSQNVSDTIRAGLVDCADTDSLTISLMTESISNSDVIGWFCGDTKPPDVMSTTGTLVVSMRSTSPSINRNFRGFKARFFFTTDFGIKSGNQTSPGECSFTFRSSKTRNGSFHSPNFPGLYPRNIICHYMFIGTSQERVEIIFSYLDVEGDPPGCGPEALSDFIELSNFNSHLSDRKLLPLCGSNREPTVTAARKVYKYLSDGNFFRVTFRSNEVYDATGFKASYKFLFYDKDERTRSIFSIKSDATSSRKAPIYIWTAVVVHLSKVLTHQKPIEILFCVVFICKRPITNF